MAQQIQFTGINRAVSDYSNTGACEELINLRPTQTGLVPVKPFAKKMEGVTFNKLYEHNVGGQVNYIAVSFAADGTSLSVDRVAEDGSVISTLLSITTPPSFSPDSLHVAVTGRILTISISDAASGTYENYCFRWRNNSYETMEAKVPPIAPTFTLGSPAVKSYTSAKLTSTQLADASIVSDTLSTAYSAIQTKNPSFCFGPCIVAIAFKTTDGDTFWTGQWYALNPVPKVNAANLLSYLYAYHFTSDTQTLSDYFPNTLAVNDSAYVAIVQDSNNAVTYLAGAEVTINISHLTFPGDWNKDTSTLKSVEIYASRPAIYQDSSFSKVDPENHTATLLAVPELPAKEMNLGDQILYLQKSYNLEELSSDQQHTLRFGGNIQVTDKTLEVDPGMITRTGSMLAYNARYHFYNANKRVYLGKPYFGADLAVNKATCDVFVTYESDNIKKQVYVGEVKVPTNGQSGSSFNWVWDVVTAPTLNITKVTVMHAAPSSNHYVADYTLSPSISYNYSIDDSGDFARAKTTIADSSSEYTALKALKDAGAVDHIDESETDAINVSEQYNPFVFRVNHSYLAPATVLDLQPQLMAVADISIGSAPLDVFTTQGVYALLQGDGTVLYSAFHALSNLISERNSASTDAGTFFIASGNLWRIAGLHSELISDALSLGPHKEIRSCSSYQSLSNNSANTYDIQPYESDPIFEDYSKGAELVYNRFRDELIVSNPSYDYSYVLSLKYRQWFKIPGAYRQEVVGSDLVNLASDTKILAGTSARLMIQSLYAEAGATTDYKISVNGSTFIEFDTHTTTSEEEAADDAAHAPQLLAEHIAAEWTAQAASAGIPLTASVDTSYTANYIRFIIVSFTARVDDVETVGSYAEQWSSDETTHSWQYPVFKTPHDIYDFSDEVEYEGGAMAVPAGASGELKVSHFESVAGEEVEIGIAFDDDSDMFYHTITEQEANSHPEEYLIPNLIAELAEEPFIQGLGLTITAGTTTEYVDLIFTTATELADGTGDGISLSMCIGSVTVTDTIASSPVQIPVTITAHLQSRPISFGYQYAHIHRVADMVRSTLYSGYNLTVALYGSDDLHSWTLLSYANRAGNAAGLSVSQLRTPSTARAWRYYTITIGGIIPVDTDFGPVLLDEAPVVRRMG